MIYLLSFAKSSRSSERNIVSPRKTSFKICRKNNSNESVKKPLKPGGTETFIFRKAKIIEFTPAFDKRGAVS